MKPPIQYRPTRLRKGKEWVIAPSKPISASEDAVAVLAHRRALKAAQMRRYRAKLRKAK